MSWEKTTMRGTFDKYTNYTYKASSHLAKHSTQYPVYYKPINDPTQPKLKRAQRVWYKFINDPT